MLTYSPWLHRFCILLVLATFVLVALGGNVTSRDAGLAVPQGFWVYDHFLWTFPVSKWVGNVFHEHIHRLKGSAVGILCIILAVWLFRTQARRAWLRWGGLAVLAMVIIQGVFGALRVSEVSTELAIVHGVTGQLFLCVTVLVAAATGKVWIEARRGELSPIFMPRFFNARQLSLLLLAVLLVQLVLGAWMRHTGAGLAIPDFPTSYGAALPPKTDQAVHAAIDARGYEHFTGYYTAAQVHVHFAHRAWSLVVLAVAVWLLARLNTVAPAHRAVVYPMTALGALLVLQMALGAMTIWTERSPNFATAHQANGAVVLATATLLAIRLHLLGKVRGHQPAPRENKAETPAGAAWRTA